MNPSASDTAPASTFRALWLDELRREAGAPINWLWQGYLAPGNVTLLTSQWKAGKTTLLSMLLDRMAAGGSLAGLSVRAGRAVVVSEESAAHWSRRSEKFNFGEHVCWLCRPFNGKPRPDQWQALLDGLLGRHALVRLDLVAIDPLASFLPAKSENHADGMLAALLPLQRLTKAGLAVLVLHHPRKNAAADGQAARGSGALSGYVDVLVEMHWHGQAADNDRRRRLLAWSRYDETPRQLLIEMTPDGTDYVCLGDVEADPSGPVRSPLWLLLENVRTKLTRRMILDLWPPDHPRPAATALWRLLSRAVERGELKREGSGLKNDAYRYWLPSLEEKWQRDPLEEIHQMILDSNREMLQHLDRYPFAEADPLE